jgi:hypothetical protein
MLDKKEFLHKILAKNLIFKTEDDVPVGKLYEEILRKKPFLHP